MTTLLELARDGIRLAIIFFSSPSTFLSSSLLEYPRDAYPLFFCFNRAIRAVIYFYRVKRLTLNWEQTFVLCRNQWNVSIWQESHYCAFVRFFSLKKERTKKLNSFRYILKESTDQIRKDKNLLLLFYFAFIVEKYIVRCFELSKPGENAYEANIQNQSHFRSDFTFNLLYIQGNYFFITFIKPSFFLLIFSFVALEWWSSEIKSMNRHWTFKIELRALVVNEIKTINLWKSLAESRISWTCCFWGFW